MKAKVVKIALWSCAPRCVSDKLILVYGRGMAQTIFGESYTFCSDLGGPTARDCNTYYEGVKGKGFLPASTATATTKSPTSAK